MKRLAIGRNYAQFRAMRSGERWSRIVSRGGRSSLRIICYSPSRKSSNSSAFGRRLFLTGMTIVMPLPSMHREKKDEVLAAIEELRATLNKGKVIDAKE